MKFISNILHQNNTMTKLTCPKSKQRMFLSLFYVCSFLIGQYKHVKKYPRICLPQQVYLLSNSFFFVPFSVLYLVVLRMETTCRQDLYLWLNHFFLFFPALLGVAVQVFLGNVCVLLQYLLAYANCTKKWVSGRHFHICI